MHSFFVNLLNTAVIINYTNCTFKINECWTSYILLLFLSLFLAFIHTISKLIAQLEPVYNNAVPKRIQVRRLTSKSYEKKMLERGRESSSIRYGSSPIWLSGKLLIISMLSPPSDQMTKNIPSLSWKYTSSISEIWLMKAHWKRCLDISPTSGLMNYKPVKSIGI